MIYVQSSQLLPSKAVVYNFPIVYLTGGNTEHSKVQKLRSNAILNLPFQTGIYFLYFKAR